MPTPLHHDHAEILAADGIEILDLIAGPACAHALISTPQEGPRLLRLTAAGEAASLDLPALGSGAHGYGLGVLALTPVGAAGLLRSPPGVAWLDEGGARLDPLVSDAVRLGDPVWCGARERLILVAERDVPGGYPRAALTSLSRGDGLVDLWAGADFISRPAADGAGRLAFMTWDLPWTPWERSTIRTGVCGRDGGVLRAVAVRTPAGSAVAQPAFDHQGRLLFLCDATGFFELWADDRSGPRPITGLGADIGLSLSRQAARSWVLDGQGAALAVVWRRGESQLMRIDLASGAGASLETPDPPADLLAASADGLWYASLPSEGPASVRLRAPDGDRAIWTAPAVPSPAPAPAPRRLTLGRIGQADLEAFHFPARREAKKGLTLLNLHGGPKSLAPKRIKGALRVLRDEGYDIVELNYRGSAGFGRAFRDQLDGRWGLSDVEDVLAAVQGLGVERGRVVLRGPSAGGFTALNAAARAEGFAGVVSYFGVTDLARLGRTTHKFEAGYLKTLVGASDLAEPVFADRSPITYAHQIKAPVLLLQGLLDHVNPPEQSIALAERIRAAGGRCELHLFEAEGHGFSRLDTLAACVRLELAFLGRLA